ncbi:MAG TPA: DUF58 domain-containing protein [Bacteroidia bacterium]|nr:DUF58 domain-containing protein [Bacteroidia bacterium]
MKNLFLTTRFFLSGGGIVLWFVFGFAFPALFILAKIIFVAWLILFFADLYILFRSGTELAANRTTPTMMSLGDENEIRIEIVNRSQIPLRARILDELPVQFQKRDFEMSLPLNAGEHKILLYRLQPVRRGEFIFGNINIYFRNNIGLASRRLVIKQQKNVPVFPSVLQMKSMELRAFSKISTIQGIKRLRRLGHSYEFEQIKNYVAGDDYRSINWKATSRKSDLMVNQYEDERAQQIYSLIDKSRSMRMPFGGMSLLDYAINTSLVISNIALRKQDKAGLITFSEKMETLLPAERNRSQLRKILESLYKQKESQSEANFELMYSTVRNAVRGRSLLFLYTNFESQYSLERVLPILRKLNRLHLLVVVFFENTEIEEFSMQPASTIRDIYFRTIAQKFSAEKIQITQQLKQYGIQSILTDPKELSIQTINKYLELKARGMI